EDARRLDQPDAGVDAVLLLGPLYHLTERADRVRALAEARRVVRPGGVGVAVAISRFASTVDGLARGRLDEPGFAAIVHRDLSDGQHRNPTRRPEWFTTAYFHLPDELATEVADAGLRLRALLAVEGGGGVAAGARGGGGGGVRGRRGRAAGRPRPPGAAAGGRPEGRGRAQPARGEPAHPRHRRPLTLLRSRP